MEVRVFRLVLIAANISLAEVLSSLLAFLVKQMYMQVLRQREELVQHRKHLKGDRAGMITPRQFLHASRRTSAVAWTYYVTTARPLTVSTLITTHPV